MGLGWIDYGFRFYDPAIARFVSVDPLSESFMYLTTYQYASNGPISNIDLDGLEAYSHITGSDLGKVPEQVAISGASKKSQKQAGDFIQETQDKLTAASKETRYSDGAPLYLLEQSSLFANNKETISIRFEFVPSEEDPGSLGVDQFENEETSSYEETTSSEKSRNIGGSLGISGAQGDPSEGTNTTINPSAGVTGSLGSKDANATKDGVISKEKRKSSRTIMSQTGKIRANIFLMRNGRVDRTQIIVGDARKLQKEIAPEKVEGKKVEEEKK